MSKNDLAERLRRQADNVENDGHLNAARYMREAAGQLSSAQRDREYLDSQVGELVKLANNVMDAEARADKANRELASEKEEADSYHRFWIEERDKRIVLERKLTDVVEALKNATATIRAIYEWVERVENNGGATSIGGISSCHAMLTSLRKNAKRTDQLVLEPARLAILNAENAHER